MCVYLNQNVLEAVARNALIRWNRNILNEKPAAMPIEEMMESSNLIIDYLYITNNGRVLGKTIFDDGYTPYYDMDNHEYGLMPVRAGTVIIDATLLEDNTGRLRFTLAHEFGHWLLHKSLYEGSGAAPANMKTEQDNIVERQADSIAAHLLMPKGLIKKAYFGICGQHKMADEIVSELAYVFDVSRQAMQIRLKECGLGVS